RQQCPGKKRGGSRKIPRGSSKACGTPKAHKGLRPPLPADGEGVDAARRGYSRRSLAPTHPSPVRELNHGLHLERHGQERAVAERPMASTSCGGAGGARVGAPEGARARLVRPRNCPGAPRLG